jgi:hypothetical protein
MSEQNMIELAQAALDDNGIDDTIVAVGQFEPRGTSGSRFAGGMLGADAGGALGQTASALGLGAGMIAGARASSASTGLPRMMFICVSESMVYGMHTRSRRREPDTILFAVPRAGLTANVHQRVNVRVLELIQDDTGARIELEGNRLPITHSKDVMDVLTHAPTSEGA